MRSLVRPLALLAPLVLAAPAAALTFRAVEPFSVKGAYDLIIVPEPWNGGLFIYAHGYTADQRSIVPYPRDITPANVGTKLTGGDQVLQIPLNLGYAAATTTYHSVGWAVEDAVDDIENIRRHFVKRYGTPTHAYIWGHSEGGMVTEAVLELASPVYEGALPFCAPGAGARRNFNGAFDLRAVYEYVCRDVSEARFVCHVCSGGTPRCFEDADCPAGEACGAAEPAPAPADGLTRACTDFVLGTPGAVNEQPKYGDLVARAVTACFGGAAPTPDSRRGRTSSCASRSSRRASSGPTCSLPRSGSPRWCTGGRTSTIRGGTSGSTTPPPPSPPVSSSHSTAACRARAPTRRGSTTCSASSSRAGGPQPRSSPSTRSTTASSFRKTMRNIGKPS